MHVRTEAGEAEESGSFSSIVGLWGCNAAYQAWCQAPSATEISSWPPVWYFVTAIGEVNNTEHVLDEPNIISKVISASFHQRGRKVFYENSSECFLELSLCNPTTLNCVPSTSISFLEMWPLRNALMSPAFPSEK